jgi:hypothetical protein
MKFYDISPARAPKSKLSQSKGVPNVNLSWNFYFTSLVESNFSMILLKKLCILGPASLAASATSV